MTDFRALCAELLLALEGEGYTHWTHSPDEDDLVLRARAALARWGTPNLSETRSSLEDAPQPVPDQLFTPPAPKGYWLLQQSSCGHIQFAIYKKPNRLHRLMAKFLLGWDWRDND